MGNRFMGEIMKPRPQSRGSFQEIIGYYHVLNGVIGRENRGD